MTPFLMGSKNKSDPHAARLSRMAERIDALRADITSDNDRGEQLRAVQVTVDRLAAALTKEQWRKDQAERRLDTVRTQYAEQIEKLAIERDRELSQLRSDLFDRDSQIAGLTAQVSSLGATVEHQKTQLEKRWWQWR